MAALCMAPTRTVERETGSGDAELVAVQLKTAIRTTRPLRNYLRSTRTDSLTAEYRRSIVDWMYTTCCGSLGFPASVVHQAVASMDRFLIGHRMACSSELLKRIAVACLHLACKINLTAHELASFQVAISAIVDRRQVLNDEYHVALGLNWSVTCETMASMLELIRCLDVHGSVFSDKAADIARELIDAALKDADMLDVRPETTALHAAMAAVEFAGVPASSLQQLVLEFGVHIDENSAVLAMMRKALDHASVSPRSDAPTPARACAVSESPTSTRPSSAISAEYARADTPLSPAASMTVSSHASLTRSHSFHGASAAHGDGASARRGASSSSSSASSRAGFE